MAAVMKTPGLAGLLTGAVALGVAELTAAVTGPNGAPVVAVGETAINLTPVPVKEFAIAHFGTHDKQALVAGIVVLLARSVTWWSTGPGGRWSMCTSTSDSARSGPPLLTGPRPSPGSWCCGRYGELFEYDAESGQLVLGSDPAKVRA